MSIDLTITNRTRGAVNIRALQRDLQRVLSLLDIKAAQWSITIVNDRDMIALHNRTMGLPTTTDVLTFDLRNPLPKKSAEGCAVELDTVLCRNEARRRSRELGHPSADELLLYAIHSLLHVQGYNDLRPPAAAKMHRREDALLIALGVGPIFHPARGKGRNKQNPKWDTLK